MNFKNIFFSDGLLKDIRNSSKEASVKARQDMTMVSSYDEIAMSMSACMMTDPLYYNNISINKINVFKLLNQYM